MTSRLVLLGLLTVLAPLARAQDSPAVADRLAQQDEKLIAALTDLANDFDAKKDPEASHLFAECALGLGSTDEKLREMRKKWENEVYYGRSRGGRVLEDTARIEKKLAGLAKDYLVVVNELVKKAKLDDSERAVLHGAVVKAELARSAHEYVQATQRFNELRRSMKLRAVLWDFEASSLFIKAAWYMAETGDYTTQTKTDTASPYYSDAVDQAKKVAKKSPRDEFALRSHADSLRSLALMRDDLLNPDVRLMALACWRGGAKIKTMVLYRIPRAVSRPDIATPTARHERGTVAEDRDLWQDIEDTVKVGDRKAIVAAYPYDAEPDAPVAFGDGVRPELGWSDPAVEDLTHRGLPIMLRIFTKGTPTDVKAELRKEKGLPVGCRVYLNGDDRVKLGETATVLLLPDKPLNGGTAYTVSIKGKLSETPFEKTWKFTTRRD